MNETRAQTLSTAALMDIIGTGSELQASVVREDEPAVLELYRERAHAQLDAYLDLSEQAATAIRKRFAT